MQYIKRPAGAPDILKSAEAIRSRRQMLAFMSLERGRRSQTSVPAVGLSPANDLLVEAVSDLSHGKCAFCEVKEPLVAHRFRPAGNALPLAERKDPHLFYLWLADAWHNLYPICLSCRPAEPQFPVEGSRCNLPSPKQIESYISRNDGIWSQRVPDERNLIIDPAKETSFHGHIKPRLDGTLIALSPRAAVTIEVFDLNREDRVAQRALRYEANLAVLRRLVSERRKGKVAPAPDRFDDLFDFERLEFGGTWLLLLKRIAERIPMPEGTSMPARLKQLKGGFVRLSAISDAVARIDKAVAEITLEDPRLKAASSGPRRLDRVQAQLRRIEIENFKAIERLTLDMPVAGASDPELAPSTPSLVVLGENATGKSSLLEAIALALTTEEARRNLDLDWGKMPLDPGQMGEEDGASAADARARLVFDSGQTATLVVSENGAQVRTEFGSERVAVFAYGAFRRFAADASPPPSSRHVRNLFDASPLAHPENWLKGLPPRRFEMVIRTLRDLLSIEGDFDVIQRVGRARELRMVTALTEPGGTIRYSRTPLNAVSSGYRSMLGMLCDILRGLLNVEEARESNESTDFASFETARGVVLIDEIEAHLHPRWKVQVMTGLRRALPAMTFIVTTHDPLCLRGMGSGEVVVLQRIAASDSALESRLPIVVERMTSLPDAADLRIEQLLTSDFFQLFSTSDAASDRRMAKIGDLVRRRAEGDVLSDEERKVLDEFERDIASALPVGSSEVHRMVQEAVATYLARRRDASSVTLAKLGAEAKGQILAALETI
ncbi:AAA family ATPase [Sphingomonas sp. A2-49]|uniref:AAA family ATPase n=1 Tax=Sphingomonas sp. A2-49 TaxID=1391375 RepID=UPI0021D29D7F|nr:AAA family ATPase [Sphingomonas sp. A2-49]MCU6456016.1 AAA family ATPase [Sphingomonas sp. A2-49]